MESTFDAIDAHTQSFSSIYRVDRVKKRTKKLTQTYRTREPRDLATINNTNEKSLETHNRKKKHFGRKFTKFDSFCRSEKQIIMILLIQTINSQTLFKCLIL